MKGRELGIKGILWYQKFVSPWLPPRCRFYPTCSSYALSCLQQKPFWQAIWKIVRRLVCCHPLHPGGVDLP